MVVRVRGNSTTYRSAFIFDGRSDMSMADICYVVQLTVFQYVFKLPLGVVAVDVQGGHE